MNTAPVQTESPVISNDPVLPGACLLWLRAPEIASIARPGQFVMLKCAGGAFLRRPLSIHRVSSDKTCLAFLFAAVGKGTAWLAELKPGDRLNLLGPLGNGFQIESKLKVAVLVAGGLGIAPLSFLADELMAQGTRVSFLYGAATTALLCPNRLLPKVTEWALVTEDGSCGQRGFVTTYLPGYLTGNAALFGCGPTPMYRALARLDELQGKAMQVSLEIRMACGLGVCYGCTVNTRQGLRQVCHHGPVFKMDDIVWEELADI